jgi:hypothetical protein
VLVEPDSATDGLKNIWPLELLCAAMVDDEERDSNPDEHAAAPLDGPSPRCSPHSSPMLPTPAGLPTYEVMAAASAVWNPGSDEIAFAIVSVITPGGAAMPMPPRLTETALCCTGW